MDSKRWLKECKCGKHYWGNSEVWVCLDCKTCTELNRSISLVCLKRKCGCGCGKEFEYELKSNPDYERKYFDKACQMRAWRRAEVGKAYVEKYNQRYKRAEREWKCKFPLCGKVFMSVYRRSYCDEHSNPTSQQKVWRKKNPLKVKAHWSVGSLYRNRYKTTRKREPCLVCGEKKTEAHHHNYAKPRDLVFLCNAHHHELHSWDSKKGEWG